MTEIQINESEDVCTIEAVIRLMTALPEWDVSELSGETTKDILYRALRKILKD